MGNVRWRNPLKNIYTDGSAKTATTIGTILPTDGVVTLPSDFFELGTQLHLRASGRISCAVTTPGTCRFSVLFGSTVVFDGLALPLNTTAKTNVGWVLDIDLVCRSIGTGTNATVFGQGFFTSEAVVGSPAPSAGGSGTIILPYNSAPAVGTGFDSTVANTVDLHHTQTVGTGSITLHNYLLEAVN